MKQIIRLHRIIEANLCTFKGSLDYDRVTDAIIALTDAINNESGEIDWYLGEHGYVDLIELITGAYWHYTEWHGGQYSKGYLALSKLGSIFEPNMEPVDTDNLAYILLDELAAESHWANGVA